MLTLGLHLSLLLSATALAPSECAETSEAVRSENRAERAKRIKLIREVDGVIELVYVGEPILGPMPADAIGVRVDGIVQLPPDEEPRARARIKLRAPSQRPCARRLLRVDDEVAGGNVIAVLDSGVVVLRGHTLFFAPVSVGATPTFRLAWQSSFTLYYPTTSSSPPPRPPITKRR